MTGNTLFTIGEIVGVHGLRGKLKVWSFAESTEVFKPGVNVKLTSSENNDEAWYEILQSSPFKKGVLLSLKGIEDVNLAEQLKGGILEIRREDLPEPEDNAYFWQDLIGLKVLDKTEGELGIIDNIFQTGAHDVLVVNGEREILVPMVEPVVQCVDMKAGTIKIDLPQGL